MNSKEKLEWEIRQTPLHERINKSVEMIGSMCAELRPPAMSIPPRSKDEDAFIVLTLEDAWEALSYYATILPDVDMNPHMDWLHVDLPLTSPFEMKGQ